MVYLCVKKLYAYTFTKDNINICYLSQKSDVKFYCHFRNIILKTFTLAASKL